MRLTLREKEIARVLQAEPLISQDELAAKLGLSRSSVAVHISNLMKKGLILGKGYVFNRKASIAVLGESYLSVCIVSDQEDTKIDVKTGGFALEVSRKLSYYGAVVRLLTIIGNDEIAVELKHELQTREIDTFGLFIHPHKRTSRIVIVNGEMSFQESLFEQEYYDFIDQSAWIINHCDYLIVQDRYQEYLASKCLQNGNEPFPRLCGAYLYDEKIPSFINAYDVMVFGVPDMEQGKKCLPFGVDLIDKGGSHCLITDGRNGIIGVSQEGVYELNLMPNQNFKTDSQLQLFLAGLVYGISAEFTVRQAIRMAIAVCSENRKLG